MHERKKDEEESLSKDLYLGPGYFAWPQLVSLVHQIIDVHATGARKVLEIGKGTGFVSDYLSKAGIEVTTVDVNPNLEPDVLGSVLELDNYFEEASFDCVLCAEVLEHLPFSDFSAAIDQIARVSRDSCVLTLPRLQRILLCFQMRLKIPMLRWRMPGLFCALPGKPGKIYPGHHWEIGSCKETKLSRVRSLLQESFKVSRDFTLKWNPYHHFFHLNKR
ncbi:MAG: methyltransferase domain-containing protein [Verrucomicrobiota bacterium]|nr:methyltransferase domain-containing protein [Verrucomicrobiota bacterium]